MQLLILRLRNAFHLAVACYEGINSFYCYLCAKGHKTVIDIFHISIIWYIKGFLHNDATGIYVVIQEECCHSCLCLAIYDGPVDRGCSSVLWQQSGMHIKCTKSRHCPHHFWQHPEGNNYLKVGIIGTQLFQKSFVLHLFRLHYWDAVFLRIYLYSWSM